MGKYEEEIYNNGKKIKKEKNKKDKNGLKNKNKDDLEFPEEQNNGMHQFDNSNLVQNERGENIEDQKINRNEFRESSSEEDGPPIPGENLGLEK